jgi:hypothetical protein
MGVPNTSTFTMESVKKALNTLQNSLVDFFKEADTSKFDPEYSGNKDSLLNFRNYGNLPIWNPIDAWGVGEKFDWKNCQRNFDRVIYFRSIKDEPSIGDDVSSSNQSFVAVLPGFWTVKTQGGSAILEIQMTSKGQTTVVAKQYCIM